MINTGRAGEAIDLMVSVYGVIPAQDVSARVRAAIEEAVKPAGGQVKWLVTARASDRPPDITLPGEERDSEAGR